MRVLVTVSSWATHYSALVPIGWALRAAAHDVRLRLQYHREAVNGLRAGVPQLPPTFASDQTAGAQRIAAQRLREEMPARPTPAALVATQVGPA